MNRKTLLWILVPVLIAGAFGWAFWPSPVPVSVATATSGFFVETIEDEGYARVRDPHRVLAPITGYLRRVALDPGDQVGVGDALFELESLPSPALDSRTREQILDAIQAAQARVNLAEAELEIKQSQQRMADAEWRRHRSLLEGQFISKEAFERVATNQEMAQGAVHAAEHALEAAQFELKAQTANLAIADGQRASEDQPTLVVRAPIDGTIINRERCCEGPVHAGEVILEIGDLSTLEVRVDLLSMDAVRVQPGMHVYLEQWGGEGVLEGQVRRVEPRGFTQISALGVEEQRVPVLIDILSPPTKWQQLGDGYRIKGRFVVWQGEDVLQIPTSAIFRENNQWQVYRVIDDKAHLTYINIGRRSGLQTEVVDGLSEGDLVITHPSDRLTNNSRVAVDD